MRRHWGSRQHANGCSPLWQLLVLLVGLGLPVMVAAEGKDSIPVDRLADRFCDVEKIRHDLMLQGAILFGGIECKAPHKTYCARCQGTPIFYMAGGFNFQLEPVMWSSRTPGTDCENEPLYVRQQLYAVRGRFEEPERLFARLWGPGPAYFPDAPRFLQAAAPVALTLDESQQTQSIQDVFSFLCTFPDTAVSIHGVADGFASGCTEKACPQITVPSGVCVGCNACWGYPAIKGQRLAVALHLPSGVVCTGNECGLNCPGWEVGRTYDVTGRLGRSPDGQTTMDVETYQVLEDHQDSRKSPTASSDVQEWGKVVDGLQLGLSADQLIWDPSQELRFTVAIRNVTEQAKVLNMALCGQVEWPSGVVLHVQLASGKRFRGSAGAYYDTEDEHIHQPLTIQPNTTLTHEFWLADPQERLLLSQELNLFEPISQDEFLRVMGQQDHFMIWAELSSSGFEAYTPAHTVAQVGGWKGKLVSNTLTIQVRSSLEGRSR